MDRDSLDTWILLQQSYLLTYKAIDQALAGTGVSHAQASVLLALARAGHALPLSRLARLLVQEAQSVTSLVDRLETRGLVQRMPDQRDRRVINVELTAVGASTLTTVQPLAAQAANAAFAGLADDDLARLRAQMTSIRARGAALLGLDLRTIAPDAARIEATPPREPAGTQES